ncbi:hypothetical protein II906_13285 [bacterium]|nr:hypothetical protein [bacterium]
MQNNQSDLYINKSKVINIKSELLYREAEDDFYYFNKINSALRKLKRAIKLTSGHTKSIIMSADIYFIKGDFKNALDLYLEAYSYSSNIKCLAGIANCCFSLKKYENALEYADLALNSIKAADALYSQLIEMKINILIELKRYSEAYEFYSKMKFYLQDDFYQNYSLVKEKLNLHKRLNELNLKIV